MGIVLYIMLTTCMPFMAVDRRETSKNIVSQRINFNQRCWMKVSNQGKDLVNRLLDKNCETRLSAKYVLKHEWFDD